MRDHTCPGGCGANVPHHQLACPACWWRLPALHRNAVSRAWRHRATHPGNHRVAVQNALTWYRNNRPATTDPAEVTRHG